jgi:ABC-type cobalamin/Fe3+-siderophores transport system ATPase subunit
MTAKVRNDLQSPPLGRESRRRRADSRAAKVRAGAGAFVVVVGPDGVGKTSVARALIAPARWLDGLLPHFCRRMEVARRGAA